MADFNLPVLTTDYSDFITKLKQRDEDIIKMLDGTSSTNVPSGAKRWNSSTFRFEKFDGTSWSALTTLYEMKVRDSDKLNGQSASYYAIATHTHDYAPAIHTHDYAASTHNHDNTYLGKTATAADSSKLAGNLPATTATGNTIVQRDSSGDITARLFKSTYAEQTTAPATTADICFRNSTSDSYMRFVSSDGFKSWLTNIGVSVTDTNTWRSITDSVSTTSSSISASATAVKTAYDKGVSAYNLARFSAGSILEAEGSPLVSPSTSNQKLQEIRVARGGTITTSLRLKPGGVGTNTCYGRIYVNGVARGTLRTLTGSGNEATYTENITVNPSDLVQLYGYYSGNISTIDSLKILVSAPSTSQVTEA